MFCKYDNEIRIINVDVLIYAGKPENLKDIENCDDYTFVNVDIIDKDVVAKIFAENEIVRMVYFAAGSHAGHSIKKLKAFVKTNVLGLMIIVCF